MARKRPKADESAPKKLGRPPDPRGPMRHILSFKERPPYKAWLDELRLHSRRESLSEMIHDALAYFAAREKFRPPPKDVGPPKRGGEKEP